MECLGQVIRRFAEAQRETAGYWQPVREFVRMQSSLGDRHRAHSAELQWQNAVLRDCGAPAAPPPCARNVHLRHEGYASPLQRYYEAHRSTRSSRRGDQPSFPRNSEPKHTKTKLRCRSPEVTPSLKFDLEIAAEG